MIAVLLIAAAGGTGPTPPAAPIRERGPTTQVYGWEQHCAYMYGVSTTLGNGAVTQAGYEACLRGQGQGQYTPSSEHGMCAPGNAEFFPVCRAATRRQVPGAE
jgi:hypothetical protein